MPAGDKPRHFRRRETLAAALMLVLLPLGSYFPCLAGGFVWDDDTWVSENPFLYTLEGLRQIWFVRGATPQYYPLVHTTFWIEQHVWGLDPRGFHVVNVLLHATAALLLWRLLLRLELPGAWLAAAVFALHPVHVESVAWITERKNVLSGSLYLGAFLLAMRAALPGSGTRRSRILVALAGLLYLGALLSKTVTASLPAAVLVAIWWKRGRLRWREVAVTAPFLVLGAIMGLGTSELERVRVGAEGGEWAFTLAERSIIAGRAIWFYAGKLVWPHPLIFTYPRFRIDAGSIAQWAAPIGFAALVIALFILRSRVGRGPLTATLFFAGTLFPALGFANFYPMRFSFVADHFQYLASIGPIALLVALGSRLHGRLGLPRSAAALIGGVVLATLAGLTWKQAHVYESSETLYRDTLAKNPDAWLAHNNLGVVLMGDGRVVEARAHFDETLRLYPGFPQGQNNMGALLEMTGRGREAESRYREALRLRPGYYDAQVNLGRLLGKTHRLEEATAELEAAIRTVPRAAKAYHELATTLADAGRTDAALSVLRRAIAQADGPAQTFYLMSRLLADTTRDRERASMLRAAVEIDSSLVSAINDLAWVLATSPDDTVRDGSRAVELAVRALALTAGTNAAVLDTLAAAQAETGSFDEAIASAGRAASLARQAGSSAEAREYEDRVAEYRQRRTHRSGGAE